MADVYAQQPLLCGRVLAVGFDVHAEIFVMFGISESRNAFSVRQFGLADRRDLTLVSVKRRQAFGG
jgi:hypothetical protein